MLSNAFEISVKEYVNIHQLLCREHLKAMRVEESGTTAANDNYQKYQIKM